MIKKSAYIILLISCISFNGCKKEPGEGGSSRIRGKVWVKDYDPFFSYIQGEYWGADIKAMLTFGDNISPDMTSETNSNGEFEFLYLQKGKYKLTIYSKTLKDTTNPSGLIAIEKTIFIKNRNETIDAGTFTIQN
ncbi:MAG: hypothetical protein WBM13_00360 [Bacteroidia bacterium]